MYPMCSIQVLTWNVYKVMNANNTLIKCRKPFTTSTSTSTSTQNLNESENDQFGL